MDDFSEPSQQYRLHRTGRSGTGNRTVMLLLMAHETPPRTIPKDNSANIRAFFMSHSFIKDCWKLVRTLRMGGPLRYFS